MAFLVLNFTSQNLVTKHTVGVLAGGPHQDNTGNRANRKR
jgi:hypothetical protein